jgi:membrane protease YdiL (CAAX protease family)
MKKTLWLLLILELAYWVPARLLNLCYQGGEIEKEMIWTALRLISIAAVYGCFRKVIWPAGEKSRGSGWGLAVVAGAAVVIVAALVGDMRLTYPANWVFAATSLAVGLREEMVYRGVLQRVLTERYGLWAALLGSNAIFMVYHLGAVTFTPYEVFQFFAMGMVLGLMYHQTKSLLLVAGVHAAYDAGECFTPVLQPPLSAWWAVAVMLAVLGVLAGRVALSEARKNRATN